MAGTSAGTVAIDLVLNNNGFNNQVKNSVKSTENAFGYETSTSVKFAGVQDTAPVDNLFNVRFLSVIDGLDYTSVGYEITAYYVANDVICEWNYTHDTKAVYTKVCGTDDEGNPFEMTVAEVAESDAYEYLYALATTDVPAYAECGNVVFVVKPYATTTTTTVYGTSAICVYNNGVCTSVSYAG